MSLTASLEALESFCRDVLAAAGADAATIDAVTRAIMHGSRFGVDSHGVRLLSHYATVMMEGRVNPKPNMSLTGSFGAAATLDADHGHGALATYKAMTHAVEAAGRFGVCAVAIRNSSHFGPAGAYALAAAEAGCIGLATCNADSFVRLHEGALPFHGTNPIAFGVPTGGARPWLLDMATSAIPYNRVKLNRSLGRRLPPGVASDAKGEDTEDPELAVMLAPLGAAFGEKGAGLAGLAEILSAVLTGMKLSLDITPMAGPDMSTPRELGMFVMAMRPEAFISLDRFHDGMTRYLESLRQSPSRLGAKVMAPGDREWAEAERRETHGVPIDPVTRQAFEALSARFGISLPFTQTSDG
jgi:LDH2 family malate/lactate/ureidoglycolate dehydrogenase